MSDNETMVIVFKSLNAIMQGLTELFERGDPDIVLVVYTDPRLQWSTTFADHKNTAKMIHSLLGRWARNDPKVAADIDSLTGEVAQKLPEVGELVNDLLVKLTGETVPFSLLVQTEAGVQYVAKAAREDIKPILQELADTLRDGYVGPPAHKVTFQ